MLAWCSEDPVIRDQEMATYTERSAFVFLFMEHCRNYHYFMKQILTDEYILMYKSTAWLSQEQVLSQISWNLLWPIDLSRIKLKGPFPFLLPF